MIVKHNKTWNRRKKLDTEQWSPQRISTHLNCSMHGECYTQDCTRTTFSAFGVWNLTTWAAIQLQFWHHINANPQMICNILFLDKLHFTVPKTPIYGITIINMGQSKVTSSDCTTCGNIWQVTPLSTFWDIIRQASAGQSKSDELRLYNLRKHLTGDSYVNFLRHHPPGVCWTVKKWWARTVQLAETSDGWLPCQLFETSSARLLLTWHQMCYQHDGAVWSSTRFWISSSAVDGPNTAGRRIRHQVPRSEHVTLSCVVSHKIYGVTQEVNKTEGLKFSAFQDA